MASGAAGHLRGIYGAEDETLETFKDGVPTFDSLPECMAWMHEHARYPSNPGDPRLRHMFTHLYDWEQVQRFLLPKLAQLKPAEFNAQGEDYYFATCPEEASSGKDAAGDGDGEDSHEQEGKSLLRPNRAVKSFEFKPVIEALEKRMALPFHRTVNYASTVNTLQYLFRHMRCGVFVCIRQNKLAMFVPFVNRDYENNWGHLLRTDPVTLEEYYSLKRKYYRKENIIPDKQKWWANGNILCNEDQSPWDQFSHYWGDNLLAPFKHMLEAMCRERCVPDVELFFNKRDHPQLKANLTEPYDFCFDERDRPLERELYSSYAPIMSFYFSSKFADLPIPTTEDWESAVGRVFPPSFIPENKGKLRPPRDLYLKENFDKFAVSWERKVNTAFFRGNATGGGTTVETNQRIRLAMMCQEWSRSGKNGYNPVLLDAGCVKFNVRDKKLFGQPMRFTRGSDIGLQEAQRVPMYEQGKFKYILYVEGHCAANRYSFLMRLGSVILKVESTCEASEMWFFPLLKPYEGSLKNNIDVQPGVYGADHVPIKADLSNLYDQIMWCRENDDKCRQIAENARNKYQRCLTRDSILDYMQIVMCKVAKNYEHAPMWWTPPEPLAPKPHMSPPDTKCARDPVTGDHVYCKRCRKEREAAAKTGKRKGSSNSAKAAKRARH